MLEPMHVQCKECNKPFTISVEEQQWLKDKGLEPFKRCSACRKKRREQNNGTRN